MQHKKKHEQELRNQRFKKTKQTNENNVTLKGQRSIKLKP